MKKINRQKKVEVINQLNEITKFEEIYNNLTKNFSTIKNIEIEIKNHGDFTEKDYSLITISYAEANSLKSSMYSDYLELIDMLEKMNKIVQNLGEDDAHTNNLINECQDKMKDVKNQCDIARKIVRLVSEIYENWLAQHPDSHKNN